MNSSPFKNDIFFQNNTSASIIINKDLIIVDANKASLKLLEYNFNELKGKSIKDFTVKKDFKVSTDSVENLLKGKISNYTVTRKYKKKSGKFLNFEVNVSLITDPKTSKKYFSGILKNVDINKTGNIFSLDKSEINTIDTGSPYMLYVHDIEARINTYENRNLLNYLGYSAKDYINKKELDFLDSLIDKEDLKRIKKKLNDFKFSKTANEILEIEYKIRNKKNEIIWIYDRSVIIKKDINANRLYSYGFILDITQRKNNEQKIEIQQALLQKINKSIPEFIFIMNAKSQKIIYSNDKCIEILGYTEKGFNDILREELVHPDNYLEYTTKFKKFLKSKKQNAYSIISKLKHKTRGYLWFEVRTFIFERDKDGYPLKLLKTLVDIDKTIKEQQRNLEKDQFIHDVTSKLPSTVYVKSIKDDKIIFSNSIKKNSLGYSKIEWESQKNEIIHKDHKANYQKRLNDLLSKKGNSFISFDILLKHKTKDYRWYELQLKVFKRNKLGKPIQLIQIYTDINEGRNQLTKINEQQDLIENITNSIAPFLYLYSYKTKSFTYTNFENRKIFGYKKEEYLQNSVSLVHPSHKEFIAEFTTKVFSNLEKLKFETETLIKHKSGTYKWINLKIVVIRRFKDGTPMELLEIVEDINELKKKALQISEQQNLISTITNSIAPYMYLYNTKLKKYTYTNFEDRTIFGYKKDEYLIDSHNFIHPNHINKIYSLVKELNTNSNKNNYENEILLKHKTQGYKWANLKIIVISKDEFGIPDQLLEIIEDINESKKKALQISEQQNLIEKISTSIPEFIYLKNLHDNKLIFSNNKCSELLGYTDQEFNNSKTKEKIHPDHLILLDKYKEKILTTKSKRNFSINILIKHKELGYRWYRNQSIVFERDNNLEPTKILELISDIHETKTNNERIIDQQKFIQNISSTIPQYLSVYDLYSKKVLYTNFEHKLIFGYKSKEYLVMNNMLIHPDQRKRTVELASAMLNSNKDIVTNSIEFLIKHKTKGYIWAKLKILITKRDKNGNGIQALEIIEDIDVSKKSYNQILDQQNFIQKVATTIPSIIQVTDVNKNKVIYSNFEHRTFLDYDKHSWEKTGLDIIHPYHFNLYKNELLDMLRKKPNEITSHEIQIKDGNGVYKWVRVINRAFKIENKQAVQVMTIFRDINRKKELQINLERQLSKNIELERFASITSHDLKEPLRTLGNYVQILNLEYKNKLDDYAIELLDYISDATKRMDELINDILEFSKVDSEGKKFEQINLNNVIDAVLKDLEEQIKNSKAEITVTKLPDILGDKTQLRQVFQNLISNAIKFTSVEIPKINIDVNSNDNEWEISVKDNGIGIKYSEQRNIFGIFQKLHRQNEYEGQGIGLSICKRIIERHDGEIWLDSKIGEGTTFYFTLPIVKF